MGRPRTTYAPSVADRHLLADSVRSPGTARLTDRYLGSRASLDMLERLRDDPGSRTLGQLLQERQWALHEIERLSARARFETPTA